MKRLSLFILILVLVSCGKETHDLTVKGTVKNLKKGTLYLKKQQDTTIVTVDSITVNGEPIFELHSKIESPEVFYLYLKEGDGDNSRIEFFADKGVTEINTTLKNFFADAKIVGSEQQKLWDDYKKVMAKFNEKNLDLIKENLEAQQSGDTSKISRIQNEYDNNLKRRYLFTVNFAINNKDSELSPYLALSEIYNAQINLLDTINNSLTPKVKESKYGKELQVFIDDIKSEENQ